MALFFIRDGLAAARFAGHEGSFEGVNAGELAVAAVHIEAVADGEEFLGQTEGGVVGAGAAPHPFEQGNHGDGPGAPLAKHLAQVADAVAAVEDVFDH